jgi:hypothetical protein
MGRSPKTRTPGPKAGCGNYLNANIAVESIEYKIFCVAIAVQFEKNKKSSPESHQQARALSSARASTIRTGGGSWKSMKADSSDSDPKSRPPAMGLADLKSQISCCRRPAGDFQ